MESVELNKHATLCCNVIVTQVQGSMESVELNKYATQVQWRYSHEHSHSTPHLLYGPQTGKYMRILFYYHLLLFIYHSA